MPDPHQIYDDRFLARIRALQPRSLLDVGCGAGALIARVLETVRRVAGIEADAGQVAAAGARGLEVHLGRAEALPFEAKSFDLVTFQFVPHHLPDWPASLREALRVAQRGVMILEGWYERGFPAQDVAARYEDWTKRIDRTTGMVHALYPSAMELLSPLGDDPSYHIETSHDCVHQLKPYDEVAAEAEKQLGLLHDPAAARVELQAILADARRHGFAYEGALTVTILKA